MAQSRRRCCARSRRSLWLAALSIVLVLAVASPSFADEIPITDKARTHFDTGTKFLLEKPEPRYEAAYQSFRAAYAESAHWKILAPLGICALHLERDGEALQAFEKYLAEGSTAVPENIREQANRDIATLKSNLVRVTVASEAARATLVDERMTAQGQPIINRYEEIQGRLELGIHPGHHRMTASAGGRQAVWEFEAKPGTAHAHTFRLQTFPIAAASPPHPATKTVPASKRPRPDRRRRTTLLYVGAGVTGSLAIAAVVTGSLALHKNNEFHGGGQTQRDLDRLESTGESLQVATDVLLVTSVVAAGATAYFYFSRSGGAKAVTSTGSAATIRTSVGHQSGRVAPWITF